jgi:S-DNA-T family DNA segregation ATPase FtsK/SpoIIIE
MRIEPSFRRSADTHPFAPPLTAHGRPIGAGSPGSLDRVIDILLALVFGTVALVLSLCLLSWTASDHSFATISSAPPRNWLGTHGALLADALMRSLGLAAILLVLPLLIWTGDALSGRGLANVRLRAIAAPVAVLCLAGFASALPPIGAWPLADGLGGYLGDQLAGLLVSTLVPLSGTWAGVVGAVGFLAVGGVALLLAVGRSLADLAAVVRTPVRLHRPDSSWVSRHLHRVAEPAPDQPIPPVRAAADPAPPTPPVTHEPVAAPDAPPSAASERTSRSDLPVERAPVAATLSIGTPVRMAWPLPPVQVLPRAPTHPVPPAALQAMERLRAEQLIAAFANYSVRAEVSIASSGPRVTTFHAEPTAGTKPGRLLGLADDLARSLNVTGLRCVPLPGRATIAVEVPQAEPTVITLADLVGTAPFTACSGPVPWALGSSVTGEALVCSLTTLGSVVIAGAEPAKRASVLRGAVASLLFCATPMQARFLVVDGPGLPLSALAGLPHLDMPIATSPASAVDVLEGAATALAARRSAPGALPPLVVVVADLAALATLPDCATNLHGLARDGAAHGVYLVAATSRLDADVAPLLGAFATRLVGRTADKGESRRALDTTGAEDLLDRQDMLVASRHDHVRRFFGGGATPRFHPIGVDADTIARIVDAIRSPVPQHTQAAPSLVPARDTRTTAPARAFAHTAPRPTGVPRAVYDRALPLVLRHRSVDADLLTVQLGIAYPQALDVLVQLQADQLVLPPDADGRCRVVVGAAVGSG